jgi:hypothetical protein
MKLSVILPALLAANASHEQIMSVVMAYEAEVEAGKDKARERWRNWRERHPTNASKRLPTVANDSKQLMREGVRVEDKTLTSGIEPQEESKNETRADALVAFDAFWALFPNKVGKPKARAAFPVALRRARGAEAIMAGLQRYIASKPADRQWMNPATFLNQERWDDQPAAVAQPEARAGPRLNPTLVAARNLMEQFDAVTPSPVEGNYPPPRLLALGSR